MEHISESVLGLYAIDPAALPNRVQVEQHLATCADCTKLLFDIRVFDRRLRSPEVWSYSTMQRSGSEDLRAFALRSAAEDRAAAELLKGFDNPHEAAHFAWINVSAKTEYRTGGVARLLCSMAHAMLEREPRYSLTLARAAVSISKSVPDDTYPRNTIHELRGTALKEQANALHRLGRLTEALATLEAAEAEYRLLSHDGIGLLAVKYIRAAVFFEQEQYDIAERLALETAAEALHLGQIERQWSAQHLQAEILFERGHLEASLKLLKGVLGAVEAAGDTVWIARESLSTGVCYLALGDLGRAQTSLDRALRLFRELKYDAEITRTEWSIAKLQFGLGQREAGIQALRRVVERLTRHGMLTDASIAAVDLAEMAYVSGRAREIPKLLTGVTTTLVTAGKLTGALTALAYLKEAMRSGADVQTPVFAYVRRFIARANRNAALAFAPPPPDGGKEPA